MSHGTQKLAIAGASGRMGQMLIEASSASTAFNISALLDAPHSAAIGTLIGELPIRADAEAALVGCDVLIDFTRPEATLAYLAICQTLGVNAVIGTTGFSDAQKREIESAAKKIAIVFAPNMSVGVNVTAKLVEMAARSMGLEADIEVFEAHHKMKVDAPSGTALMLGDVAAKARGQHLSDVARYDRHGVTGAREAGTIGFSVVRAGDIIGDHTVYFVGQGERIEITHRSSSRATYATGALRAASFLAGKKSGLFSMDEVLGLNAV